MANPSSGLGLDTRRLLPALALVAGLIACSADAPPEGAGSASAPDPGSAGNLQGRVFERAVVFLTSAGDSTLIVPWLFSARTKPGGVDRTARAWLARGGEWEPFLLESWETSPTRVPWRLHPRGKLRLVVGEGEALEALLFEEGARRLEVQIGGTRAQWSGSQGETFLVEDGAAILAERRLPGLVLDLARVHRGESPPPGDWMFLTSGDSVQVVLSGTDASAAGAGTFEGWARLQDSREIPWRDVSVSWVETRAFERARREVPVRWSLAAGSGEMDAELEVQTAHIEAGEGAGPLLPVDAFFEVAGNLRIAESAYPVRGLVRHVQR